MSVSNYDKILAYDALDERQQKAQFESHVEAASAWMLDQPFNSNPLTCETALRLLHKVPPVKPGGQSYKTKKLSETERNIIPRLHRVSLVPDWMDGLVVTTNFDEIAVDKIQRMEMGPALMEDRLKPFGPDEVEQTVDHYHRKFILDPACKIAGVALGKQMRVEYAPRTDGSATDLRVCDEQATNSAKTNYIVAEDKRGLVWLKHESKLLTLLTNEEVRKFERHEEPPSEVRICIQIYVQMQKFRVSYGKILSPAGVIYVRRGRENGHLEFSRIYHDLDNDAQKRPRGPHALSLPSSLRQFSEISFVGAFLVWLHRLALQFLLLLHWLQGTPTIAFGPEGHWSLFEAMHPWQTFSLTFPKIFSTYIGSGASGDIWLSRDRKYVLKVFTKQAAAEKEADILLTCQQYPEVAVPTFHGLYSDGWRFAIVTRYAGSTIGPLEDLTQDQRQQLLSSLHALHRRGIHHHDVRSANVMVDESGAVTLIDFDRAERIHGECKYCSDVEVVELLEMGAELEVEPENVLLQVVCNAMASFWVTNGGPAPTPQPTRRQPALAPHGGASRYFAQISVTTSPLVETVRLTPCELTPETPFEELEPCGL
ncbi:hypothetical protein K438DRAFT_1789767 [Mycena galopus ATCC 62051]|nr:hypothetical protein K438DRAFT_1789767 [Mycena galopus ATCC 62051]